MDSSQTSAKSQPDDANELTCPNYDPGHRLPQLDFLRGIAILLVLFYHPLVGLPKVSPWEAKLFIPFAYVGWIGVNLFFVLSGFLISGLIYNEYSKTGSFKPVRFLIRRAFKIWPGYYVFLFLTLSVLASANVPIKLPNLVADIVYLQNYIGPVFWPHTWSLAVEEHFYICITIVLYFVLARSKRTDYIPYVCGVFMILPLVFRILKTQAGQADHGETHLSCDALAFGVLLRYFYSYTPERLKTLATSRITLLLGVLSVALGAAFHPKIFWFGFVFGLNFIYIGWGLVLIYLVHRSWKKTLTQKIICTIGIYSYSIYLWSPAISYLVEVYRIVLERSSIHLSMFPQVCMFVPIAIFFGIAMARLVEFPMLRLRDRMFPAKVS